MSNTMQVEWCGRWSDYPIWLDYPTLMGPWLSELDPSPVYVILIGLLYISVWPPTMRSLREQVKFLT